MIRLSEITQHYGVRPVLRKLDLEIPGPGVTAIVGPNGMGKTTLLVLVVSKLASYGGNHGSPLSLMGRLRLRQWIIPGYYRILVAPLVLIVVVPLLGLAGGHWQKLPGHTLIPLVTVLALWCYNLVGPDPTKWKLTCPARITLGKLSPNNYQQLT